MIGNGRDGLRHRSGPVDTTRHLDDVLILEEGEGAAVGDIERLTTNLSQKIWQKITLVETEIEDVRGAKAMSTGELTFAQQIKND